MRGKIGLPVIVLIVLSGCGRAPSIGVEIDRIRAVDNHAHPVRVVRAGEQDREFDALPVDNMEPSSDPIYLRPGDPGVLDAWRVLFGSARRDARAQKQRTMQDKGDGYPAWVLDQMGIEVMLANRG